MYLLVSPVLSCEHNRTMRLCFVFICVIFCSFCKAIDPEKQPRVALNDGNSMPVIGLGTFLGFDENGQKQVKEDEVYRPVTWAIDAGYRLFDTASAYHNEDQVGKAILDSSVPREDIFVVTKLGSNEQRNVAKALKNSLSRLNMSYVDLYLIHNPVAFTEDHSSFDIIDYLDTWKGMEEVKKSGLAKSIGISNFNISQMERLLTNCEIKPSVLQVEVNLNLGQDKLLQYTKKEGIVVMAYTPFGTLFDNSGNYPQLRVDDPVLVNMAKKHNKTVPQIILRYLVQRGVVPIPKSIRRDKIKENIDIFDFTLNSEEMIELGKFNKDYRTVWPSFWQDHPYYPFERKDNPDPDLFKTHKKD